ncbi:MAG: histidine kinase dimerization/phospho-acceptor domain-containing protein, partial [Pseudomonadota bacterium]
MFSNRIEALLRRSAVRQTLWLLALFSLITLAAWGATYWLVQREMVRNVDDRLVTRMAAAVAALDAGAALPPPADGQTAAIIAAPAPDGFTSVDLGRPGPDMRFFIQTTPHGRIRLGENTERQEELREILAGGMQLSLLATLLATALAGLWMARRAQARMDVIGRGLAAVARGDLTTRIALRGADDLSLLADRINATTARLDDAVSQTRVQSSNIAHDLRTPLARLRAQLETSQIDARAGGRAVDPEELDAALEQIDQINGAFEALLRLAQIES